LGLGGRQVLAVKQVHSRTVLRAETAADLGGREGDGIVVGRGPLLVSVTVADCMPIFLFDRESGAFGLLHSGWKGTGILRDGIELLEKGFGAERRGIVVVLGPSIGSCCYEVDEGRFGVFKGLWGETAVSKREGKHYLDLRAANLGWHEARASACNRSLGLHLLHERTLSFRRDGDGFNRMIALLGYVP
jgi:copper oxidase (laccase) domain-containing protein